MMFKWMNKSQEYKSFEIDAVTETEHDYLINRHTVGLF